MVTSEDVAEHGAARSSPSVGGTTSLESAAHIIQHRTIISYLINTGGTNNAVGHSFDLMRLLVAPAEGREAACTRTAGRKDGSE